MLTEAYSVLEAAHAFVASNLIEDVCVAVVKLERFFLEVFAADFAV
jgi:hypothetical protein